MRLAPQQIRTFFVTAVTWQRRALFKADPMARLFLNTLGRYRDQGRFQLHEFVLMPDHFHALITPAPEISLEKAVQLIKGGFSFRVKRELGLNLEIWQEGFTEHRVKGAEDFERHAVYIRENPARARLAESAEEYPYSSAAGGVDLDPTPPWLKPPKEIDRESAGLKASASTDKLKFGASIVR
jgi:putative transposase